MAAESSQLQTGADMPVKHLRLMQNETTEEESAWGKNPMANRLFGSIVRPMGVRFPGAYGGKEPTTAVKLAEKDRKPEDPCTNS